MSLFPLKTVLFPDGRLALRVFEQRYVAMTKRCLREGTAFGVCLIRKGDEVAGDDRAAPEFEQVGTSARIVDWDVRELGIFQLVARGEQRFRVVGHRVERDGLVVADVEWLAPEPTVALPDAYRSTVTFLETAITKIGTDRFPLPLALGDASWVGYRLAELLPLPPTLRQGMLEINDAQVRLALLAEILRKNDLL